MYSLANMTKTVDSVRLDSHAVDITTPQKKIARACSIGIRFLSYFFLRWALLPAAPAIIATLFAVYIPSFISGYRNESKYQLVDDVDLVLTETTLDEPADEGEILQVDGVEQPLADEDSAVLVNEEGKPIVSEQVEIQESLSVHKRPLNPLSTLLSGAPNPRSLALSVATLLINVACVGLVADRLFREHQYTVKDLSFARLGYVSYDDAKLLIREPDQTKMPVTVQIRMKDAQPPFDNPLWQSGGSVARTTNDTDYTAVITIPIRNGKQRTYEWKTSNDHFGQFTSPAPIGEAAETGAGPFTFLSTSCIVNRLPYNPFDHPLAIPGLRHLAKVLPTLNAQFMLFLGDFIYVDVPRWWGKGVEDYRQKYRQVYASPDWQAVSQNLSWIHVIDDHEISNDWSAGSSGVYTAAVDPYNHYQAAVNPPLAKRAGALTSRYGATYFEFTQGPASFFLLDTRTYRSSNKLPATDREKTMLGAEQLEDLLAFLERPEPKGVNWKIIASSVPFTKNWRVNTQDTWGGFLVERQRVLEAMWDVANRGIGVVVLSGDRHEFAATKFPPPAHSRWPETSTVWEFSASPLSQFYSPIPSYRQTDNEDVKIK